MDIDNQNKNLFTLLQNL